MHVFLLKTLGTFRTMKFLLLAPSFLHSFSLSCSNINKQLILYVILGATLLFGIIIIIIGATTLLFSFPFYSVVFKLGVKI